jgi:hypothetical protein
VVTFVLSGRELFCIALVLLSILLLLNLMPRAAAQQVEGSLGDAAVSNVPSLSLNPSDRYIYDVILGGLFETFLSRGRSNFPHLS